MKSQKSPTKITGNEINKRFGVEDSTRRMRKVAEEELLRPLQVHGNDFTLMLKFIQNRFHEI